MRRFGSSPARPIPARPPFLAGPPSHGGLPPGPAGAVGPRTLCSTPPGASTLPAGRPAWHWVGLDAACAGSTLDEFALAYLAAGAITRKQQRPSIGRLCAP